MSEQQQHTAGTSDGLHLIICVFEAEDVQKRADEVRHTLKVWDRHTDLVRLGNVAVVAKDQEGEVRFRETQDIHQELGSIAGAVAGSVAWFIYTFVGLLGSVAGQTVSHQTQQATAALVGDMGFPDKALREIGIALDRGSFALITLVRPADQELVVNELENLGGTLVQHLVPPHVVAQLERQRPEAT